MATKEKAKKTKATTKTNTLNVAFVWDMSGSMGSVHEATRQGTYDYLTDLVNEEAKLVEKEGEGVYTRLSLTIFDTVFERWLVNEPISSINPTELVSRYHPRGGTALYDAIAHTITEVEAGLADKEEKVLVIVMTDGQENSSQDYALRDNGRQRLFDLIQRYEAKGNWTFVYLGANVDAYSEAQNIGIAMGNVAHYSPTAGSTHSVMAATSSLTNERRNSMRGQTVTAFADAGISDSDYRDEDKLWTPGSGKVEADSPFLWTPDKKKKTRRSR
jgi:hypothetical protein